MPVVGCWLSCVFLIADYRLSGVAVSTFVVGSWLSGVDCRVLVVACLFRCRWLLLFPGCGVSVVGCWLLIICVAFAQFYNVSTTQLSIKSTDRMAQTHDRFGKLYEKEMECGLFGC